MARQSALRKTPVTAAPPTKAQQALAALTRAVQIFTVELQPFPDGEKAVAFQEEVRLVVVTDVETHRNALELLRRGKALKRGVEEHWQRVTRWLDERKREILTIKAMDLELVEPGLKGLNDTIVVYENAERERVRHEQERQRIENERIAQEKRDRELADLERQAEQAESASSDLSDRERAFVQRVYAALAVDAASERWLNATAKACGFRQENYGVVLMGREKITHAIEAMKSIAAIRQQAEAVAEKPLEVTRVEVQSNIARVAGTRTVKTYTGECFDYRLYVESFQRGVVDIEQFLQLTQPSTTGGNSLARSLKANLDRVPGWRHILTETKAG